MSETATGPTALASQYSAQVAGDLERNLKEQERIGGEIEALQAQLTALQQDHAILVGHVAPARSGTHQNLRCSLFGLQRHS